jgi:hypothetical protein
MLAGLFFGESAIAAGLAEGRTGLYVGAGLAIALFAPNSQALVTRVVIRAQTGGSPLGTPWMQGSQMGTLLFFIAVLTLISASWGTNEFIYFNF